MSYYESIFFKTMIEQKQDYSFDENLLFGERSIN